MTIADLQRVAKLYLRKDKASTVIVCPPGAEEEAQKLGLEIVNL